MKQVLKYKNRGLLIGLLCLLVLARIITPSMFTIQTIIAMLRNNAVYVFLAIGMMVVVVSGGIDLSVGSTLAFAGVLSAALMFKYPMVPSIVWIALSMLTGMLCGAFNGFVIGYLKMVPMIATLCTMYIYRGFAFLANGGHWIYPHQIEKSYQNWASLKIFGIHSILWLAFFVFMWAAWYLNYRTTGRQIYAIGSNVESANVAGISEPKIRVLTYTISGILSGLAGMLYVANYATCTHVIGEGYEMQAIAICVLGGVNIKGGKGSVDGVFIGWLMMSVITQFISLLPGMSVWQKTLQGLIIIIAVLINTIMERTAEKRFLKERGTLI